MFSSSLGTPQKPYSSSCCNSGITIVVSMALQPTHQSPKRRGSPTKLVVFQGTNHRGQALGLLLLLLVLGHRGDPNVHLEVLVGLRRKTEETASTNRQPSNAQMKKCFD